MRAYNHILSTRIIKKQMLKIVSKPNLSNNKIYI